MPLTLPLKPNETMRVVNPKLEMASGDYDIAKHEARRIKMPHTITVGIIEKRLGLPHHSLRHYRTNYLSRKNR